MIYSGELIKDKKKYSYMVRAGDPDDVCFIICTWPYFEDSDISFISICEHVCEGWTQDDMSRLLYEGYDVVISKLA